MVSAVVLLALIFAVTQLIVPRVVSGAGFPETRCRHYIYRLARTNPSRSAKPVAISAAAGSTRNWKRVA